MPVINFCSDTSMEMGGGGGEANMIISFKQ